MLINGGLYSNLNLIPTGPNPVQMSIYKIAIDFFWAEPPSERCRFESQPLSGLFFVFFANYMHTEIMVTIQQSKYYVNLLIILTLESLA
jgi:hypothetical protein